MVTIILVLEGVMLLLAATQPKNSDTAAICTFNAGIIVSGCSGLWIGCCLFALVLSDAPAGAYKPFLIVGMFQMMILIIMMAVSQYHRSSKDVSFWIDRRGLHTEINRDGDITNSTDNFCKDTVPDTDSSGR